MLIIIEGKSGEGKSKIAHKISDDKLTFKIKESNLKLRYWTSEIESNTEVILIDDIRSINDFRNTLMYSNFREQEYLEILKKGKESIFIKMPDIVLVGI